MKLEKDDYVITYQNTEDGAPVSNFNDTLMVYMVKYGTGQAGFVMDDEGKKNLNLKYTLYRCYESSGNEDEAVNVLKDILSYDEKYEDADKTLADIYYKKEDADN